MDEQVSRRIAAILGPAMAIIVAAEFPLIQPGLYSQQTAPNVFTSGALMLVAGLAIVSKHNFWRRSWIILVTLLGWAMIALGAIRLFTATDYHQASSSAPSWIFMAIEAVLIAIGLFLTFKAYAPPSRR